MTSRLILVLASLCLLLGLWNCQDIAPSSPLAPGSPTTARITGTVHDVNTGNFLQNAKVYLASGIRTDSVATGPDGVFRFEVDLSGGTTVNALLTVRKKGYYVKTTAFVVSGDSSLDLGLLVDLSTSALIGGVLRDSATLYPLRNATVLLTLPGVVDSVTTPVDGSFQLTADLVDRDSIPVVLTAFKGGYKTRQLTVVVHKGQSTNLGNLLLNVDVASTVAQILGQVLDSQSNFPISHATVQIFTSLLTDSVYTSNAGQFSFSINLQGLPSISGFLAIAKAGYKPRSFQFTAPAGGAMSPPTLSMRFPRMTIV